MRFSNTVTVLRPQGLDEYGNPSTSFASARRIPAKGLRVSAEILMLDPASDVQAGDRIDVDGITYQAAIVPLYNTRGVRMYKATLSPLDVQP